MIKAHWSTLAYVVTGLLLGKVLISCFYFWAELLTLPGAVGLGVVSLCVLVRLGIQVICFPKSFYYFRRESEVELLALLSGRWFNSLAKFIDVLTEVEGGQLPADENEGLLEVKVKLENVLRTYALMAKSKPLTDPQHKLQALFQRLQSACSDLKVNSGSLSFWEAMGSSIPLSVSDFNSVLPCTVDLMTVMKSNLLNDTWTKSLTRWFWNSSIGSLDYLRCELETTFKCEQVWVPGEDGTKLDCMWVQGTSPSAAVLMCGGNGFVYECALYMSDSIQHYLQKGLSIMMWNYRGYGRTKGWPSPSSLNKDGLKVAEYVLKVRNISKLMVHGESMGGMVACHIASRAPVTVLFADRTFASIESIAETYSEKAKTVMRLLTQWSTDVVSDYINAKCFKMVSSDTHDSIIPDMASLKNGVANRLVQGTCEEVTVKKELKATAEVIKSIRDATNVQSRQLPPTLQLLKTLIEELDAGGKFLKCITCDGATPVSLTSWSSCMLVWGSFYSREYTGTPCIELAITKLTTAISLLTALSATISSTDTRIPTLKAYLTSLNNQFISLSSMFPTRSQPAGNEFDPNPAFPSAGFLIPLSCGHNGCLSREERRFVDHLIRRSGLLLPGS